MLHQFYGFWEDWYNYHKLTFDGENKIIQVNTGVTELDVKQDIYSDWKEWMLMYDHGKFEQAMRSVGGDPTTGGNFLGASYFLTNGWRMRSWAGDHRLVITGNLFTEEGEPVFIPTIGNNNTEIVFNNSTLVEGFGYDVPGQYDPEDIADAVWAFSQLLANNPGSVGQALLDIAKRTKQNQGLIASGLG